MHSPLTDTWGLCRCRPTHPCWCRPAHEPPLCPLAIFASHLSDQAPAATAAGHNGGTPAATAAGAGVGVDVTTLSERWAVDEMQVLADGEEVVGLIPGLAYLLLARRLLLQPLLQPPQAAAAIGGSAATPQQPAAELLNAACAVLPSLPWWALRCVMAQQAALTGRSNSLLQAASQVSVGARALSPSYPCLHTLHARADTRLSWLPGRLDDAHGAGLWVVACGLLQRPHPHSPS